MDLTRIFMFVLALYFMVLCSHANVSSVKKKKSVSKPHGRHVANKKGWSTLFDPRGGNNSHPNIAPVVVSSESVSQKEAKILSAIAFENMLNEKKRRRRKKKHMRKLLKKARDDTAIGLAGYRDLPRRKCRNWSQCKKDECCIRYSSTKGYCKKRPQKGHRCRPVLLPGLRDCPCDEGLTCKSYKTTRWGLKKHRCERLKYDEDEQDQRYA